MFGIAFNAAVINCCPCNPCSSVCRGTGTNHDPNRNAGTSAKCEDLADPNSYRTGANADFSTNPNGGTYTSHIACYAAINTCTQSDICHTDPYDSYIYPSAAHCAGLEADKGTNQWLRAT